MVTSSLWQSLTAAALIGTERQPFKPITTDGKLGELLAAIDASNPEKALLNTVAVVALYQKAGQVPLKDSSSPPSACELEDLPRCSDRTAYYLNQMLNGQYAEVLPELLTALATKGLRINESNLPALLDLGKRQSALREKIIAVLGKRGQWLAAQNPDWNYVVSNDDISVWETGSKAARLIWLQRQRHQDPHYARECLEKTWKQENASDRAAFLETFLTNISMADEPFLESALDDRSKEVRRIAAKLLIWLPESRFCQRMIERTHNSIQLISEDGQEYFSVDLLESYEPGMARDGIKSESPYSSLGNKTFWMSEIIASTPLSIWTQRFSRSPAELIRAAIHPQSDEALKRGFTLAAQQTGNLVWIQVLLEAKLIDAFFQTEVINRALIDPEQQAVKLQMLKTSDSILDNEGQGLLRAVQKTLLATEHSPEVGEAILEFLERSIENYEYCIQNFTDLLQALQGYSFVYIVNYIWHINEFMRVGSIQIAPPLITQAQKRLSNIMQKLEVIAQAIEAQIKDNPIIKDWDCRESLLVNQFMDVLQWRQEMLQSITGEKV